MKKQYRHNNGQYMSHAERYQRELIVTIIIYSIVGAICVQLLSNLIIK
jgi:hypothetical protein